MSIANDKTYTVNLTWPQMWNLKVLLLSRLATIQTLRAEEKTDIEYQKHLKELENMHYSTLEALDKTTEEDENNGNN